MSYITDASDLSTNNDRSLTENGEDEGGTVMEETLHALVAGSRHFMNYEFIKTTLNYILPIAYHDPNNFEELVDKRSGINASNVSIELVSGGAPGVDTLTERYADEMGFSKKIFLADWGKYGKSAGFRRNAKMHEYLKQFEKRICICFWNRHGKGTAHNFGLSKRSNTPLIVYDVNTRERINPNDIKAERREINWG